MNIIHLIILSTFVGLIIFISTQNVLFIFSKNIKEREIELRIKNFVDLINRASKISTDYFYFEYFLGLSNLSVKNNILQIDMNGKSYKYYLEPYVKDTKIIEASRYCVVVRIYDCERGEAAEEVCDPQKCKEESILCKGPNKICIGDGYCNAYINENCRNSPNDCKVNDLNKVCCPEDPSADKYGYTDKKNLGEECYCDNQCKEGLKCNPVDKNFKDYRSNRACCPENKVWNGKECKEIPQPRCPDINSLPKRFDWRNVNDINYINPVRDQGNCGSCWAFSAIGVVENVYNIEKDCPRCNKDLSEQFLISIREPCCGASCGNGCQGGFPWLALEFIKNKGVCDEECYKYKETDEICNPCQNYNSRLWKIYEYGRVPPNIERIKQALICYGPLSVSSFNWAHAVVLVGYDDDSEICRKYYNKNGCWIIRNSWGPITGIVYNVFHERGYGYIPYEGHQFSDLIYYVFYVKNVNPPV